MQDVRLYINELQVELTNDEKVYLSSKVNKIGVPENIKSSITRTFKVYKSNTNLQIFDYLGIPNNTSQLPYTDVSVKLFVNGIQIFKKGILASVKNGNNFWSIVIKEGNANFFSLISEYSIQDLDLTEYEHEYVINEIIAQNANNEGVIWPIIDLGLLDSHPNYIDAREMLPAVFEKTIFDAIFNPELNPAISETWSYSSEILGGEDFAKKIIPCITNFASSEQLSSIYSEAENLTTYTINALSSDFDTDLLFDNIVSDENENFDILSGSLGQNVSYINQFAGKYKITLDLDFEILNTGISGYFVDIEIEASTQTTEQQTALYENLSIGSNEITFETEFDIADFSIIIITLNIKTNAVGSNIIQINTGNFKVENIGEKTIYYPKYTRSRSEDPSFYVTSNFPIAKNLPDISQKDFIKQIMLRYGLIVSSDIITNTISFVSFDEIKQKKDNGIFNDYTSKLDLNGIVNFDASNFKADYEISSLAKTNQINYKSDETVISELGNSSFDLESVKYKGTKKFIEFLYSATESKNSFNGQIRTPKIQVLRAEGLGEETTLTFKGSIVEPSDFPTLVSVLIGDTYNISKGVQDNDPTKTNTGQSFRANVRQIIWDGTEWLEKIVVRENKISPRILNLEKQDIELQYRDTDTIEDESTNIPLCTFSGLEASELISNYYQAFINAVSKPVIQYAKYLLDIDDFVDFDHFTLIYDKNFNSFFFVEEVNRFNPDNSAEFKMLKIE